MKRSLYSVILVKAAYKNFSEELIGAKILQQHEWVAFSITNDNVKLQACRFKGLKAKDFTSICSSIVPGNPCWTKYTGVIPCPRVAEKYLKYAVSIEINTGASLHETRSTDSILHTLEKMDFSKECYYCQHSYEKRKKVKNTTSFNPYMQTFEK